MTTRLPDNVLERLVSRHYSALQQALTELSLSEVAELQAPITPAYARELLALDMNLNAQGLEVWLDRD